MAWIQRISRLDQLQKEGLFRPLIPPSLYHRFGLNPLNFCNEKGFKAARFFSPEGDRTCLVEIKLEAMDDPLYSTQLSDSTDTTMLEWDFLVVNDPSSQKFNTHIDPEGKDTLFGWASRNIPEEIQAVDAGYFPGQSYKGMGLTREAVQGLDFFCRIFNIKCIRLEALFYHNAITYERLGFSYFEGYKQMKRIHELFQPDMKLFQKLDHSTPFRKSEFAYNVRGRSWAIHDGILNDLEDDLVEDGWVSPVMYRMVENPRAMVTFPDPVY
jgi:hypothetical protein